MTRLLLPLCALMIGLVAHPSPVAGQQQPACADPIHSAFDFWVGEWEVRLADGSLAGHNTIRPIAGGCGLAERWRGAGGGTGESLNFHDPADGQWHQLWVGSGGLVLRLAGGPHEGGMRLEGHGPDPDRLQRVSWTPLEDGRVRQHWVASDDGGKTWTTVFDGYYAPADSTAVSGASRP